MATGTGDTGQTDAVAEAVGDAVTEVVETVVAETEQRAEQAEQVIEIMTEAAHRDALNRRYEEFTRGVETWQTGVQERVSSLETQLSTQAEQLSALTIAAALQSPPTPEPSIQPPQSETPGPEVLVIDPATGADDQEAPAPAKEPETPAPRKKHRSI